MCIYIWKKKNPKTKKPKTLVLSQVIGETFLSSNFHLLLRDNWSFVWKQYPQPVHDSQPDLERCFCTILHSTLVLQEFITWDVVVVEQPGAASSLAGWGPASPSGHQQLCMKAGPPCRVGVCVWGGGGYQHLGSFVYGEQSVN